MKQITKQAKIGSKFTDLFHIFKLKKFFFKLNDLCIPSADGNSDKKNGT